MKKTLRMAIRKQSLLSERSWQNILFLDPIHQETVYTAQHRWYWVLQYFKNGTQNNIVDPTSDKKWLRKKAEKLGILLSPGKTNNGKTNNGNIIIQCPEVLRNEIGHPKNAAGWTKDITNLPKITIYQIEQYHKIINDLVLEKSLKIKKPFTRGAQFLEENFIERCVWCKLEESR
ncbi:uncharacterized protein LOC130662514 [Hydractinia symbiolongicarpus]|uniref:uncharacterized protein LOC130662514 n=1 Tax=Hydractinia symbiolongicarpus TaxID=13093 RepID=UPI00255133B1|nr:uncharacterized protein LOC130662514 [Hydractinia symbiolongicarpus]